MTSMKSNNELSKGQIQKNTEPEEVAGLKNIRSALEPETFPMNREELNYAVGDMAVGVLASSQPVRDLTDHLQEQELKSPEEVTEKLAEIFNSGEGTAQS